MPRASQLWLAAVLALAVACRRDAFVERTLGDAHALSEAIVTTVRDADDPAKGVAAARALLDERRPALQEAVAEMKALDGVRVSDRVRQRIAPELVADLERVEALRAELSTATAADPELDAALRRLVADYAAALLAKKRAPD